MISTATEFNNITYSCRGLARGGVFNVAATDEVCCGQGV